MLLSYIFHFFSIFFFLKSFLGEILGEKQWKWLELALQDSHADFHGIISSIQILTTVALLNSP